MKPVNFLLGLFLLLLGTVFFMNSLGYRSWIMLRLLPLIGPIFLILLGLGLLWRGTIPRGIAVLLILLFVGTTVALFLVDPRFSPVQKAETHLQIDFATYPELSAGKLNLKYGAGELTFGTTTEYWAEARFRGLPAVTGVAEKNRKLHLDLKPEVDTGWPWRTVRPRPVWEVKLSPQLPWEIELKTGAVKGDLNLTGIPLRQLDLKLGAGAMTLKLGGNGQQALVKIKAGASSLRIVAPTNTGLSVKLDGAVNKTNMEAFGLILTNQRYVSDNYETATERIDLELAIAVSNLEIIRIPDPADTGSDI